MRVPDEIFDEIRQRLDVASVFGRYVQLKKQGKRYVGLCPFHQEKTPSFTVNIDEGLYFCFGCQVRGNIFQFVERQTGQHFMEVVRQLAAETGVEIPERQRSTRERENDERRESFLHILDKTQAFFRESLRSDHGRFARTYLEKNRKVSAESIEQFGIGYAPPSRVFMDWFAAQHFDTARAIEAGILGKRDDDEPYPFFRDRLMFPIRDFRGRIVTFAGRALRESKEKRIPKYVNGPGSFVYDKSRVLYGGDLAKDAMRKKEPAVIVEGQLDVIACHHEGIRGAVAPCGTSLTEQHVNAIKRFTERAVVCFDSDRAGKKAAAKATLLFLRAGFEVKLVLLDGRDPDDYVKAGEGNALKALIRGAPPAIDVLLERASERAQGSITERLKAIDTLMPYLSAHPRELVRNEMLRRAAAAFGEDEAALQREIDARQAEAEKKRELAARAKRQMEEHQRSQRANQTSKEERDQRPVPAQTRDPRQNDARTHEPRNQGQGSTFPLLKTPKKRVWSAEERLLARALLCYPSLVPRCGVLMESIKNEALLSLIKALSDTVVRHENNEAGQVIQRLPVDDQDYELMQVVTSLHGQGAFEQPSLAMSLLHAEKAIDDFLVDHDAEILSQRVNTLERAIATLGLPDEERRKYQQELKELNRERARLKEARSAAMEEAEVKEEVKIADPGMQALADAHGTREAPKPAPEPDDRPVAPMEGIEDADESDVEDAIYEDNQDDDDLWEEDVF